MDMDGWVDYLHVEFLGEHILFRSLRLKSLWSFTLATIVITIVCLGERYPLGVSFTTPVHRCAHPPPRLLTVVLNKKIRPSTVRNSRLATAAWRSSVYGFVTFLRL